MYGYDYMPSDDEPLIAEFTRKFSGRFGMDITDGHVFYSDINEKTYDCPETKTQFFDLISGSIKQNKNLFFNHEFFSKICQKLLCITVRLTFDFSAIVCPNQYNNYSNYQYNNCIYPKTYLVCVLIHNKCRENNSKPIGYCMYNKSG